MRTAHSDDLPAVERLLAASGLPTAGVAEILAAHPADFVVVDDPETPGELAAVAGLERCGDDALLRSVAVRPAWQHRALGRALVQRLADDARHRGVRALYLLTTTAEHYFPRFGFTRVERDEVPAAVADTVEFRSACPASATAMRRTLGTPLRVLVLCTGNSARSQIAEALLTARGGGRVVAESAGSHPAPRVNPHAVEVLSEHGVAWAGRVPRGVDALSGEDYDLVITVCDDARDACPVLPGAAAHAHWGLPDPADATEPDAARRAFRETYDALLARVDALLALPLETLDRAELGARAQAVHDA